MSQFLFIQSNTNVLSASSDNLYSMEYEGAGQIALYFKTVKDAQESSVKVVLDVESGKEQEAIRRISEQLTTRDKVLLYSNVTLDTNNKKADNTIIQESASYASRFVTSVASITHSPTDATSGLPVGGEAGQYLKKDSATDFDVSWDNIHTLYINVRNTSGGTLAKGTPVHAVDVTGEVADVIAARADTPSAMPATYVLNEEVANNAIGQAIIVGEITGVDTSLFSPGDKVYVGSTGGFTNIKPTGTNLIQNLGVVTKSNANTGSGVVLGAGRSNDIPNIPENYIWVGNASGVATPTDYTTLKSKQIYSQGFIGDPATTQYYLPWKDINEQTTIYQEEAAMIMPYSGRIVSTEVRVSALTVSTGDITISIHTCPTGLNQFSGASWTVEETETLTHTVVSSYYHTFHFVFDNAQHFEAGDLVAIGYLQSADLGSTSYYYVTTVVEYDYTNTLGSTSTEHGSNP